MKNYYRRGHCKQAQSPERPERDSSIATVLAVRTTHGGRGGGGHTRTKASRIVEVEIEACTCVCLVASSLLPLGFLGIAASHAARAFPYGSGLMTACVRSSPHTPRTISMRLVAMASSGSKHALAPPTILGARLCAARALQLIVFDVIRQVVFAVAGVPVI